MKNELNLKTENLFDKPITMHHLVSIVVCYSAHYDLNYHCSCCNNQFKTATKIMQPCSYDIKQHLLRCKIHSLKSNSQPLLKIPLCVSQTVQSDSL